MKRQLLLLMLMLPWAASSAEEIVEIGGIYYELFPAVNEAKVTVNPGKYSGNVVIPASFTINETKYSVTGIAKRAFNGCDAMTSVTIPSSMARIEEFAFNRCSKLASVHISDVGAWCGISFSNYEANPLIYAHHLYLGEEEIRDLEIPSGVTAIGNYVFAQCSRLTSVVMPSSVKSTGVGSFYGCSSLTSLSLPDGLTSIGREAFSFCNKLFSVTIPNSVTSIGVDAFEGCSGLTSITIPASVTSIGYRAFYDCSGLTSVSLPDSVANIETGTFYGCRSLTTVSIPGHVESIGANAFEYCSSLASISIPDGVKSIEDHSLQGCESLTTVVIPNSVTGIGKEAFSGCSRLSAVTIGSGVIYIGNQAFASCGNLADVYCLAEELPSMINHDTDVFHGSSIETATLHVPASSVAAYKAAEPWNHFNRIVPLDGSELGMVMKCATPSITYSGGKLLFTCATEGVEYVSEVTIPNKKKHYGSEMVLDMTCTVSVYAVRPGYADSDVATIELRLGGSGSCDVNNDGDVNVADIATIVSQMAEK